MPGIGCRPIEKRQIFLQSSAGRFRSAARRRAIFPLGQPHRPSRRLRKACGAYAAGVNIFYSVSKGFCAHVQYRNDLYTCLAARTFLAYAARGRFRPIVWGCLYETCATLPNRQDFGRKRVKRR